MTRGVRNTAKPEQISLRLPTSMIQELDKFKEREGTDRTAVIIRALKYWISVDGKVTTDTEYLTRLTKMEEELNSMQSSLEDITSHYEAEAISQREIISELQKTITTLLRMMPKDE